MPVSLNRTLLARALAAAFGALLCAAIGWGLTQSSKLALLPLVIGAALALWLIFAELGLTALWLWPPLGVITYPLANHLPGGKYVSIDRIWVVGMVVLLVSQPKVRAHVRASRRMLLGLVVLAVVLGVRAILTPASSLYPIRTWFDSLLIPLILFAIVRRVVGHDGRMAERVALSMMIAGCVLALIGVAEHFIGFSLAKYDGSQVRFEESIGQVRIAGPYDAPEPYGLALVMCLAASMYWIVVRKRAGIGRAIGISVVGLELLAIFFTYFRVGWISAIIVMIATLGLRPGRYGRAVAALVISAIVLVPLITELEKIPAVQQRVQNTDNIYTRIAIYKQGWQIFKSHPLFGVGSTDYNQVASVMPIVYVNNQPSQPYPHSSLFEVMSEDGVVGLIALLVAVVAAWRLVRAFNRASRVGPDSVFAAALVAACISYLIYSLTLTMLPYSPPNEFLALLLGVAAGRLDAKALEQRQLQSTRAA
jgi:O-antigen ligase